MSDLQCQLDHAGGQEKYCLEDVERAEKASVYMLRIRCAEDVYVFSKSELLNSCSHDQSYIPCTYSDINR